MGTDKKDVSDRQRERVQDSGSGAVTGSGEIREGSGSLKDLNLPATAQRPSAGLKGQSSVAKSSSEGEKPAAGDNSKE